MLLSIYGDYGEETCWVTAVVYVWPGQQIDQGLGMSYTAYLQGVRLCASKAYCTLTHCKVNSNHYTFIT